MYRGRAACLAIVAAAGIAACGGGGGEKSTLSSSTTAALYRADDLPGFKAAGAVMPLRGAAAQAHFDQDDPVELKRLKAEGFVDSLVENLAGPGDDGGYVAEEHYRSAAGAKAELTATASEMSSDKTFTGKFKATAVPGSDGFSLRDGGTVSRNLFVVRGKTLWFIGFSASAASAPSEDDLGRAEAAVLKRAG